MALIKCPECHKENVSDQAEMCPYCGFGIKAHFDKIKQEEDQKERQIKFEEELKKLKKARRRSSKQRSAA